MANAEKIAGVNSFVLYGVESTYGTAVACVSHFGLVQSVKPEIKNNLIKSYGFAGTTTGGRNVVKVTGGKLEVRLNIEFLPQVGDWLVYVLGGARTGSGTAGAPYVYSEASTVGSLTICHDIDNVLTDRDMRYVGCLVNSCGIRTSVGEPVSAMLDIVSADIVVDTTVQSAVALSTDDIFTFAGGSIEIPGASALPNIIDSVEITIANTASVLHGFKRRSGEAGIVKQRDYQVKTTLKYFDNSLLTLALGSATNVTTPTRSATMVVKFTSGPTKSIDFVFTGVTIDSWGEGATINEVLTEDITFVCESLVVREQRTA